MSAREQREEDIRTGELAAELRAAMALANATPGPQAAEVPAGGARRVFRPVLPGPPGRPPPQLRQAGSVPPAAYRTGPVVLLATGLSHL